MLGFHFVKIPENGINKGFRFTATDTCTVAERTNIWSDNYDNASIVILSQNMFGRELLVGLKKFARRTTQRYTVPLLPISAKV